MQRKYKVSHDGRHKDMTAEEVLVAASAKKDDGNACFKRAGFTAQNEDFRWAARRYTEGIQLLNTLQGVVRTDRWARGLGATMPDPSHSVKATCAGSDEVSDGDGDDIIDLGPNGFFDAVAHDQAARPSCNSGTACCAARAAPATCELAEKISASARELHIALLLNRAAAHLKIVGQGGNDSAEKDCNEVLALEPTNAKGLFRRGQARTALHKFKEAQADLMAARKLQPKDSTIRQALQEANKKLAAHEQSKKTWTTTEEDRRRHATNAEHDAMRRLSAADVILRKQYGDKWDASMEATEKRQLVLDMAVEMELQRTAPKSVFRTAHDMQKDLAQQKVRVVSTVEPAVHENATPTPQENGDSEPDSWAAFWQEDVAAERDRIEKDRIALARAREQEVEQQLRSNFKKVQAEQLDQQAKDQAALEKQNRRVDLEAVAARQRAMACVHTDPKDAGGGSPRSGFLNPVALVTKQPLEEIDGSPASSHSMQEDVSASLPAKEVVQQVWNHCTVPPLHAARARYGSKWAQMTADEKRAALEDSSNR